MKLKHIAVAILSASLITSCANDPHQRAKIGAAIGAVTGAVIGHQVDDDNGRYVGAAVGALAGGAVGNYMDKQQQELERQLAEEQAAKEIEMQRLADNTIKLDLSSEVSFDSAKSQVKPSFYTSLDKIASVLSQYDQTVVHVVGHTDSDGSDAYNMDLSLRRADAVKNYLMGRGVSSERLQVQGRGESEPRASNSTAAGKAMNRRVEVFLKPIIEGQEQSAYTL